MSRSPGDARRRDRHRHDDRVGVRHGRLLEALLAPRHEQRRRLEAARLDRALPEPVAARAVARGGRVKADCARNRTQERGGRGRIDDRAGRDLAQRAHGRAAGVDGPVELDRRERAQLARPRHAGDRDRRARAASEPASSESASRRPAVPPSDTIRTSTRGIRPGILPRHGSQLSCPEPSPSAGCARPSASRRGRWSCTRASSRSPARPTSCRSCARRTRSRRTPRSRRTGARWSSPGRSRSRPPGCSPR